MRALPGVDRRRPRRLRAGRARRRGGGGGGHAARRAARRAAARGRRRRARARRRRRRRRRCSAPSSPGSLGARPGDLLRLTALGLGDGRPRFTFRSLRVARTFETGFSEFDRAWAVVAPEHARRAARRAARPSFEVALADARRAPEIAETIRARLGPEALVADWTQLNRELFAALASAAARALPAARADRGGRDLQRRLDAGGAGARAPPRPRRARRARPAAGRDPPGLPALRPRCSAGSAPASAWRSPARSPGRSTASTCSPSAPRSRRSTSSPRSRCASRSRRRRDRAPLDRRHPPRLLVPRPPRRPPRAGDRAAVRVVPAGGEGGRFLGSAKGEGGRLLAAPARGLRGATLGIEIHHR